MKDYRDLDIHLRRQSQLIQERDHERLVQEALKARPGNPRRFGGIFRLAQIARLFQIGKPAAHTPIAKVKPLPSSH